MFIRNKSFGVQTCDVNIMYELDSDFKISNKVETS